MRKRIVALLLAVCLVVGMVPTAAAARPELPQKDTTVAPAALEPEPEKLEPMGITTDGLEYDVYSDHIEITGYTGGAAELIIPDTIEDLPVTKINLFAFSGCTSLTSVVISDNITELDDFAFMGCDSLVSVVIGSGVTRMTDSVFSNCSSLSNVVIRDGVTEIGFYAFRNCSSLSSIVIPDSVTSILSGAFNGCTSLTNVVIGNGVTTIESYAFEGCTGLTCMDIPDNVTTIEWGVFRDCTNLTDISISDSITIIYDDTFYNCTSLTNVVIPDSVTAIGDHAFNKCTSLSSLVIGDGVTSIGSTAFMDCDSLSNVVIPKNVTTIGDLAFANCNSLENVDIRSDKVTIGKYAFNVCYSLVTITIPKGVKRIDDLAFGGSKNLKSINFEGDAPQFGADVFSVVTATAYYPSDNPTWTSDVMQDYGGNITWVPYNPENVDPPAPGVDAHDTIDQLTEVDYLAFSKLAYRNLDQHIGKTVKEVIGNKWDEFWTDGTTTEFLNSEIYGAIANWTVYKTDSGEDGFYYAVFKAPNAGQAVLSYRGSTNPADIFKGSEDAIGDWIWNDLPMLLGGFIGTQFEDACKAYTDLASDPEIWMITTTGHSLGGAWADAISALYGCDGVSMNAVPILDVVYDNHPQYYGATFTGLSDWNFVDHANVLDVLAGMNEALFSSAPIKPYISHKSMYTGANIATPHSLWPLVQRSSDGSVCITDVEATSIPNAAVTQERKLSYVSLGSTSNDILNKGMKSLKRQSAYGGNGIDQIYTGSSWDKLVGGAGFDVLDGGYGDDTYFYFKGDGHDYIRDIGGSDALYLYGYTTDDAIAIVEDEDTGFIDVYCNGEPAISIYRDGREYKSFTFDKFEVFVVWEDKNYDTYDITSFFNTRNYGSHLLISCPVSIEILDPNGNVVYTLTDGEVGSWYTDYGNFYVFEEENGEYGKVLDLVEGYTARIVGAGEGTMDVTYQVPVDGELTEPVSVSNVPVTEELIATVEENEEGDVYLIVDSDGDGETDSEKKLYAECPFEDVTSSDYYYEPVLWAVDEGITDGVTETEFAPEDTCKRSQVVTFLWRAAGEPKATSRNNPFVDVKSSDYFYEAVLWAVEKGITDGMDETHFEPDGVCNRSQVVTFLYRAFEEPPVGSAANPFTDVPSHKWYATPVLWAVKEGITDGVTETSFAPEKPCTRAQVVTFLYRAYN